MILNSISIVLAYMLDRMIGDPRFLPHPVVIMGKCIVMLEKGIRKAVIQERQLKIAGVVFPILIAGGSFFLTSCLLYVVQLWTGWLAVAVEAWFISTTIAVKGLQDAAMEVYKYVRKGDLQQARYSLSMIVGRDTDHLDEREISRGVVETVAENIVDAIISPLFYACIGGAPLAMAYRAINTLDSMVGYKNEMYRNLGWASARVDDVCNYIPARITAILIMISCIVLKLDVRQAWMTVKRDAKLHPSPNSGIPEAAVAGALHIQLGGTNFYKGIPSHRAKMGIRLRDLKQEDILTTIQIMRVTALVFVIALFIFVSFIG